MKEVELKPCPFCGGGADIEAFRNSYGMTWFAVFCRCADCNVHPSTDWFINEEGAAKAWNTRKPMEQIVEYLKEQCERETKRFKDTVGTETGEKHFGWLSGLDEAIHKIKEVGG